MTGWTEAVDEPFRSNAAFWGSVAASVGSVVALALAVVLHVTVGGAAAVAYVVPVALLVVAAASAKASSAATRPTFASREEWRDAERHAVATALVPRRRR